MSSRLADSTESGSGSDIPLREELVRGISTSLRTDQEAYRCERCNECCLNPEDHLLTRARLCVDCCCYYLTGR